MHHVVRHGPPLLQSHLVAFFVRDDNVAQEATSHSLPLATQQVGLAKLLKITRHRVGDQRFPVHVSQKVAIGYSPQTMLFAHPGKQLPLLPGQLVRLGAVVLRGFVLGKGYGLRAGVQAVGEIGGYKTYGKKRESTDMEATGARTGQRRERKGRNEKWRCSRTHTKSGKELTETAGKTSGK